MENTDVLQTLFNKRGDFKPRQISSQLHPCTGILLHFVGVIVRFTLCTAMLLNFVGLIFILHTFNNQDKCDLSAITIIIKSLDNP